MVCSRSRAFERQRSLICALLRVRERGLALMENIRATFSPAHLRLISHMKARSASQRKLLSIIRTGACFSRACWCWVLGRLVEGVSVLRVDA